MKKYLWILLGLAVATVASGADNRVFALAAAGDVDETLV